MIDVAPIMQTESPLPTADVKLPIAYGRMLKQSSLIGAHPRRKKIGEFERKLPTMCTLSPDHVPMGKFRASIVEKELLLVGKDIDHRCRSALFFVVEPNLQAAALKTVRPAIKYWARTA